MSDNDKYHLRIPDKNIQFEKIEKHAGGTSFRRDNPTEHGIELMKQADLVYAAALQKKDFEFSGSLYMELRTPVSNPIRNERLKLKNLGFEVLRLLPNDANSCIARITKANFSRFLERAYKYSHEDGNPGKSNFGILEDIREVPFEARYAKDLDNYDITDIIIFLYETLSRHDRFTVLNSLENELRAVDETVESHIFHNGAITITCRVSRNTVNDLLSNYLTIKSVDHNYTFNLPKSTALGSLPSTLKILPPSSQSVVAIIDTGVNSSSDAFKDIVEGSIIFLPGSSVGINADHGTFVASRCVYGDEIDKCLATNTLEPYCKILDVTVFGADGAGNYIGPKISQLASTVEHVVRRNHKQVRVYNLSLGGDNPINDFQYSILARTLDSLAKTYDVLFVVAAGNMDAMLGPYPVSHFTHPHSRISAPAESLLAITVGSIAKYDESPALAKKDEISPFSRIGPGADGGIKPELVCHGGNLTAGYLFNHRISSVGLNESGTHIALDNGTSFSAPIVSQYVLRMLDAFPDASSNLIKALLFHFAEQRSAPSPITHPTHLYTGFGEPQLQFAINSRPKTLSYIYEGVLDSENYYFIGFTIPKAFQGNRKSKLKIKATIVFNPDFDPISDVEYSMAKISATLFKAQASGMKDIQLDGDKKHATAWNPVYQFEKEFARNYVSGDWQLRLRLYTRGKVPAKYQQNFAAIIEIIDAKGQMDVFHEAKEFLNRYDSQSSKTTAA